MNKNLVKIAEENVSIFEKREYFGQNLTDDIEEAIESSIYYPTTPVLSSNLVKVEPKIFITEEKTHNAIERAFKNNENAVALNFASGKNPGGGYLRGAKAQEEDLCRVSLLGPILALEKHADYYLNNKKSDSFYTHDMIYTGHVPFIRNDNYDLLQEKELYTGAIITSPAPNLSSYDPAADKENDRYYELIDLLEERATKIFKIAAHHNHDHLILGAWGCGVFGNNVFNIIDAFKKAMVSIPYFKSITFAIYDNSTNKYTLNAFRKSF